MKSPVASVLLGILLFAGPVWTLPKPERFQLALQAGGFLPTSERFQSVYPHLWMVGIQMDVALIPDIALWVQGNYLQGEGELTVTADPVKLTMIPATLGGKLFFRHRNLLFYLGAGGCYVWYREKSSVEGISEHRTGQFGYAGTLGLRIHIRSFFLELNSMYRGLKIPAEYDETVKVDAGGIAATLGAGIAF